MVEDLERMANFSLRGNVRENYRSHVQRRQFLAHRVSMPQVFLDGNEEFPRARLLVDREQTGLCTAMS